MANLNTLNTPTISVSSVNDSSGTQKFNLETVSLDGYYTRKITPQSNTTTYTTSTTRRNFTLGPTFPNIVGCKAGSLIHLHFYVPTRNNDEAWGGIFLEPQVRFNSGSWFSLGGTGYDIMLNSSRAIQSYTNSVLFDPQQTVDFDIQFRFYWASYDGSTTINGSHSINSLNGDSPIDTNTTNANQHYLTIKVEELAKWSGV